MPSSTLAAAATTAFDAYLLSLIQTVAGADQRPQWHKDSVFKRFDKSGKASAR